MPYPEDFADQLARLRMMAKGDDKWDLSDNDRAAIQAVLDERDTLANLAGLGWAFMNEGSQLQTFRFRGALDAWKAQERSPLMEAQEAATQRAVEAFGGDGSDPRNCTCQDWTMDHTEEEWPADQHHPDCPHGDAKETP